MLLDPPSDPALIEVEALTQDYPGHRALDGVSFTLAPGSVTALVGPNGAGKTTLMRCLAALDPPFAGRVRVAGLDAGENPREVHRLTGFLQDFFGLYDSLTVNQGLWYAAAARRVPHAAIPERIQWAAGAVGLSGRLAQKAGTLSRGLRQRLAVAQTVVHRPRVVLLDEPASGLDPESRAELAGLLRALRSEHGMTLLVSSHILAELEDYSTHVMILNGGRLVRHDALATAGAGPGPGIGAGAGTGDGATAGPAAGRIAVTFSQPVPDLTARLSDLATVETASDGGETPRAVLAPAGGAAPADLAALLRTLVARDLPVCGFEPVRRNLQEVYLEHVRNREAGGAP